MALTKACILENISNRTGFSKKRSAEVLETLLETIKQTLESGEEILVRRFGKFSVRDNNWRKGRNSSNSKEFPLDAIRVVTFKGSSVLIKKISEEGLD